MNKLKFDGQVTDLFAEDFKYLQDNLESEVGKGLSQIIEDIPRAAVIKGFNPYITSYGGVSDTGIAVSHGLYSYSKGSIVTTDGLIYQTSTAFAAIPLPSYFEGHYYYICAVYSKVDGTYNKQTGVVDEGVARAIDYANYTLVYDREVDQCEILSYIDTDYVAITDFSKIVILGRVTVDSLGKIVSPIDETIRETILINIPDESITYDKLNPNSLIPQIQIQNTSSGSIGYIIDDQYPLVDNTVDLKDDLNKIRSAIRLIKGTATWDTAQTGVIASDPDLNILNREGVLSTNRNTYTTTLDISGTSVTVATGKALVNNVIKFNNVPITLNITTGDNTKRDGSDDIPPHPSIVGEIHQGAVSGSPITLNYAPLNPLLPKTVWGSLSGNIAITNFTFHDTQGTFESNAIDYHTEMLYVTYYSGLRRIDTLVVDKNEASLDGLRIIEGTPALYPVPDPLTNDELPIYYINKDPFINTITSSQLIDVRQYVPEIKTITEFSTANLIALGSDKNWVYNKFTFTNAAELIAITSTGFHNTIINSYNVIKLDTSYRARIKVFTQTNDEVWIQLVLNNVAVTNITLSIGGATSTITIPAYGSSASKPILFRLYKGLTFGWHELKIYSADGDLNIYKIIVGKLDQNYSATYGSYADTIITDNALINSERVTTSNTTTANVANLISSTGTIGFGGLWYLEYNVTNDSIDFIKNTYNVALTSYWTFDSNLTDSVGSNQGTAVGGAASSVSGKFNNGLTLNGSSQAVTLADVANLRPTGDFTVGFWINSSYVANYQYVIQNMISVTSNFYGFWIATAITTGYVSLTTGSGTPLISGNAFSGTVNVCNGSWHYVVVTVKNNWGQIYVDGVLDGSGHISSPVYYSTVGNSYSSIGANRQGVSTYSYWLNGKIDDLFFINGSVPNARDVQAKYVAATAQGTGLMSILPDKKMRLYTSGNLDIVGVIREVTSIT